MINIIIEGGSTYYSIIILLIIMAMVKHQAKVSKNWNFGKRTTTNKFLHYKSIFIHLENVKERKGEKIRHMKTTMQKWKRNGESVLVWSL